MTDRPLLLDLFCGAGGAAKGYQQAGFEVAGVDIKPQPRYCGEHFLQGDALEVLTRLLNGESIETTDGCRFYLSNLAAIHASPPCQWGIWASAKHRNQGKEYPYMVGDSRTIIHRCGIPYVIEQPVRGPLVTPIVLCGSMFGIGVIRHRWFELWPYQNDLYMRHPHGCRKAVAHKRALTVVGNGGNSSSFKESDWAAAMGIDWMTRQELTQAIPPAYTEFIGRELMKVLTHAAV